RSLKLNLSGRKVKTVTVDMGKALPETQKSIILDGEKATFTPVNVGNPHAVVFVDDIEKAAVSSLGLKFQSHKSFPDGVNVEFAQIISENRIRMRVFERGSGITMACGTGACAAVAAAVKKGFAGKNTPVTVMLDGGNLEITVSKDNYITMTGPAKTVYEGETFI
ncbi:MAG: diaminopimelate epimerase, partial [Clostridia bacterium]|nr:diaminopimelate epimerase [Clostridia bacterium]